MRLYMLDVEPLWREKATVTPNRSLGGEWYRKAYWVPGDRPYKDEQEEVTCEVIAFATGIVARRNEDGSTDLLDNYSRLRILKENEYVQPIERAAFKWTRRLEGVEEIEWDYSDEVGLFYAPTQEEAYKVCRMYVETFDFEASCDPEAW